MPYCCRLTFFCLCVGNEREFFSDFARTTVQFAVLVGRVCGRSAASNYRRKKASAAPLTPPVPPRLSCFDRHRPASKMTRGAVPTTQQQQQQQRQGQRRLPPSLPPPRRSTAAGFPRRVRAGIPSPLRLSPPRRLVGAVTHGPPSSSSSSSSPRRRARQEVRAATAAGSAAEAGPRRGEPRAPGRRPPGFGPPKTTNGSRRTCLPVPRPR